MRFLYPEYLPARAIQNSKTHLLCNSHFLIIKCPGKSIFKHPDTHGIRRGHQIIITHHTRVNMIVHQENPCSFQFNIDEDINIGIVSRHCLVLSDKSPGGRYIFIPVIRGIIHYLCSDLGIQIAICNFKMKVMLKKTC